MRAVTFQAIPFFERLMLLCPLEARVLFMAINAQLVLRLIEQIRLTARVGVMALRTFPFIKRRMTRNRLRFWKHGLIAMALTAHRLLALVK